MWGGEGPSLGWKGLAAVAMKGVGLRRARVWEQGGLESSSR